MTEDNTGQSSPHLGDHFFATQDLYRYRTQRGVNLGRTTPNLWFCLVLISVSGSWFVLERWITATPFKHAAPPAQSDLDVAQGGADPIQLLNAHWDNWITEDDWRWIAARGLNTVRIPVRNVVKQVMRKVDEDFRSDFIIYAVSIQQYFKAPTLKRSNSHIRVRGQDLRVPSRWHIAWGSGS